MQKKSKKSNCKSFFLILLFHISFAEINSKLWKYSLRIISVELFILSKIYSIVKNANLQHLKKMSATIAISFLVIIFILSKTARELSQS